jgi:hypothetical protein
MAQLFSNGTEYESFLEMNCEKCKKFVHFEDSSEDRPVCQIEEMVAHASFGSTPLLLFAKLIPNEYMHRYDCTDKEATNHE